MGIAVDDKTGWVERFRRDGMAVAGSYLEADEVTRLQAGADRLIRRFTEDGHRSQDYWCFDVEGDPRPILYRIHNLERQDWEEVSALHDPRLLKLAEDCLGAPAEPTAFALVLKEPYRGAEVPWHRDRCNVPASRALNLSLSLDAADKDSGCLEGVPGSQLLPDDADVAAVRDAGPVVPVEVSQGDVVIHDVRLVHGSGWNNSARWRRTIVIEYAVPTA